MREPFVLSADSAAAGDPERVWYTTASHVTVLGEEGGEVDDVHPDAVQLTHLRRYA